MSYATPLPERQRIAALQRKKYWSDDSWRLRKINRARVFQGLKPYTSADQIKTRGPLVAE